jgi:hypothetical protein
MGVVYHAFESGRGTRESQSDRGSGVHLFLSFEASLSGYDGQRICLEFRYHNTREFTRHLVLAYCIFFGVEQKVLVLV